MMTYNKAHSFNQGQSATPQFRIQSGIPFTTVAQDIRLAVKLILIHKRSPIEPLPINRMPRDKITNFTVNNFLWKQQHFAKNYIR